jgi:hypothetical protein
MVGDAGEDARSMIKMPTLPYLGLATRRSRPSRVFWLGIAGGLVVALALQTMFIAVASLFATDLRPSAGPDGTGAMISASLACLAAAGTTGFLTQRSLRPYVALNAFLTWSGANAIFMVNTALNSNVLA